VKHASFSVKMALDSQIPIKTPCTHVHCFKGFSGLTYAYTVQANALAEDRWYYWSKECNAEPFIMECFTDEEAKALRLVIIVSILFILFDLFLRHSTTSPCRTFPKGLRSLCARLH